MKVPTTAPEAFDRARVLPRASWWNHRVGPGRRATSWATIAAVALKVAVRDPVGSALA